MSSIANFTPTRIAAPAISCVSASLSLQGTGKSVVSVFGGSLQAPKGLIETGKPKGWHPEFAKAYLAEAHLDAVAADRRPVGMHQAASPNAHPVSVLRSRHRSRHR